MLLSLSLSRSKFPSPSPSCHTIPPLFVSIQRNVCVISDVLDSWPCDQRHNMEIQNPASSRLTFVHSVSRFHGHVSLSCFCISVARAQPFPASFRLPTKLVTYISEVSVFRPVRWSGSPGLSLFCQLVGRSVVACRARANPRGGFFRGGGFVVVMYTMCRFVGFVCLLRGCIVINGWMDGWLVDWMVALLTLGVGWK
jgi:hypothetical protein